mmetsp:Transcript_9124/g.21610  ORF Transcript_9124/g.21610 Transcript_9124/m.21610 type:complete len:233 (-) Transcript_9124:619-1317(-)
MCVLFRCTNLDSAPSSSLLGSSSACRNTLELRPWPTTISTRPTAADVVVVALPAAPPAAHVSLSGNHASTSSVTNRRQRARTAAMLSIAAASFGSPSTSANLITLPSNSPNERSCTSFVKRNSGRRSGGQAAAISSAVSLARSKSELTMRTWRPSGKRSARCSPAVVASVRDWGSSVASGSDVCPPCIIPISLARVRPCRTTTTSCRRVTTLSSRRSAATTARRCSSEYTCS